VLDSSAAPMPETIRSIIVAPGGNAILSKCDSGGIEQQIPNMDMACRQLVPLVRSGNRIVITHGNGPQVGNLLVQQEESTPEVPQQAFDSCVAMTQGQIGASIQPYIRGYPDPQTHMCASSGC